VFKPGGIPAHDLTTVVMTLDEYEAVRLADLQGLYQAEAAERMGVSRPTFGRIVESAHRKVAQALVHGQALLIEGGAVVTAQHLDAPWAVCCHAWQGPDACPRCGDETATGPRTPSSPAVDSRPCRGRRRCGED
jgi:predicted DNA-binding protein (UPF0251 family)